MVWFELFLTNIEKSHPGAKGLLESSEIAIARSMIPGALNAFDKTMEATMKFSKSSGRIDNFSKHICSIEAVDALVN